MGETVKASGVTKVEQKQVVIPDLTIKDLLSAIPEHCFKRSAFRSSLYILWDFFLLAVIYSSWTYADAQITPERVSFPNPYLYPAARFCLWALYSFAAGLVATGLWVIAHECGHQAFSESKLVNNTVGWILHSALGVPYHSWRISHARHHASTSHMTADQVFVPKTRSQMGLPAFDPAKEELDGSSIANDVKAEFMEALGDSPIGASLMVMGTLLFGWPLYVISNRSGQRTYPKGTSHFIPGQPLFKPHEFSQVIISVVGVLLWIAGLSFWVYARGFADMFLTYFVPYLWVNHWLVLITFLQHTDPILPHYRPPEFTFARGALSTLDRNLLGEAGKIMGWIGATATHGISETHVAHHVHSKIPHYHAWDATDALRARLARAGIHLQGKPAGWIEMYRVYRQCKFVEDDGNVLFYKNAQGLAVTRPIMRDGSISDSGVEIDSKQMD